MKIRYNYEDYFFISARIRSLEGGLIGREKMNRMASASGMSELSRLLSDVGIVPEKNEYGVELFEKALSERFEKAYRTVFEGVPDKELFTFFTYQYDCHNLKSAIKAEAKGKTAENIMLPYGSVEVSLVQDAVRNRDFSVFPENMARASAEAAEAYAKTGDPQKIDLLLDKACFEDIKSSVELNPVAFFAELLKLKADTLNIFTALRLCRMPSHNTEALMDAAFLPGGSIEKDFFTVGVKEGETYIAEELKRTGYSKISDSLLAGKVTASKLEQLTDDLFITKVKESRQTLAGAEVCAGYLAAMEYEVKNMRIILAGKKAGRKPEEITERLRENYV